MFPAHLTHVVPYDGVRAHVPRPAICRLPETSDHDRHTGGLRASREQAYDVARATGVLKRDGNGHSEEICIDGERETGR